MRKRKTTTYYALLGDLKVHVDDVSDPPVVYVYGDDSSLKTGIMVQGVEQLTRLLQVLHYAHRRLKPEKAPAIEKTGGAR